MPIASPASEAPQRKRVRAWFGETTLADYVVASDLAERYAAATASRFGLRTTIDPVLEPATERASAMALWQE